MSRNLSIAIRPLRPVALGLRSIVCGVVAFAALSSATVLAAQLNVAKEGGVWSPGVEDGQPYEEVIASSGPLEAHFAGAVSSLDDFGRLAAGSAEAYSLANYGILKARASAEARLQAYGGTDAQASFSDLLFIHSSPGLDGESGSMSVSISVDWELLFSGVDTHPFALAEAYLRVGSSLGDLVERLDCSREYPASCYPVRTLQINGNDVPVPSPMGFMLDVPIVFGQGVELYGFLRTVASAIGDQYFDHPSYASVAADHSFYWGGIDAVSYQGSPVSFTVTSDSGTGYARSFVPAAAVPAPATLYLVAPALLALAGRRFRRGKT